MIRLLRTLVLILLICAALLYALLQQLAWRPAPREALPVACTREAPPLLPGQVLKVMTWNVQYLAGKRYAFWYDLVNGSGPEQRPSAEDLAYNLDEVARVIRAEAPDVVLLQELDKGATATDHQDQLALLRERLTDLYPCATQAYDWQGRFVPYPSVLGSVGRQLATLSRFRIGQAERVQLAERPAPFWQTPFQPRRALLTAYLPQQGGGQVAVINTHLDAYSAADDTQLRQVQTLSKTVDKLEAQGTAWLVGGDLNLLPLGQQRRLPNEQRDRYSPASDLHLLWDTYPMIPSNSEAAGADRAAWLTHFPNDPSTHAPDRTLDYLVHSPRLQRVEGRVRQEDTLSISDHLPVVGRFLLPAPPAVNE
ncbi:endonuclease/exonuclease/phosphatase family protein [Pseudomonas sp. nanlin1]|uniref:endonuclease/exonuclease/phosphatase family protein n=1 Tax=Pseudomonas sp. nanlin1 TaxID=3040605 RepID=UPI00388E0092